MINAKTYQIKSDDVEAVVLTTANAVEVSNWLGGKVFDESGIIVPTLQGNLKVLYGQMLSRKKNDGELFVMEEGAFHEKYRQVGLRQDGPQFRTIGYPSQV